jgi:hypothetical protein
MIVQVAKSDGDEKMMHREETGTDKERRSPEGPLQVIKGGGAMLSRERNQGMGWLKIRLQLARN